MAADELRVTNVKDFRDAVHEILDAPPPSSASNLWHLGRVVFVDVKGRDLGRPRPEAPHCSLELISVVVPSLQQAFVFDVSAHTQRTPGELVCLAVLLAWSEVLPAKRLPARSLLLLAGQSLRKQPRESATPRPCMVRACASLLTPRRPGRAPHLALPARLLRAGTTMALAGILHWGGAAGPPCFQREGCGPRVSPHTPTPYPTDLYDAEQCVPASLKEC